MSESAAPEGPWEASYSKNRASWCCVHRAKKLVWRCISEGAAHYNADAANRAYAAVAAAKAARPFGGHGFICIGGRGGGCFPFSIDEPADAPVERRPYRTAVNWGD